MKEITRAEYNALLQWADDGGAVFDLDMYEIRDERELPLAIGETKRGKEKVYGSE